ncbi:MAG: TonB-dependent receptor [Phenylobacterium sp.]|uniref:TonB-dependent receptor n=1 Tax=Phenylobacterium sp. TaxID=1871053 RepID=UPI001A38B823|nr:TonB-dependent receptor [Phenylobacterium sp.]MBL8772098.1 TonB-dependent receptor [Phenylobacterium sp.]
MSDRNGSFARGTQRGALLSGAALALVMGGPALAQTAGETEAATVETVVVTAQRRVEENIKVPVAVTAVGAAEIQNITAGFVTDIAIKAPNVTMTPGTNSPVIQIRGVSSQSNINAGFPPAVGVYVDEVYQGRDPTFNTILNDVQRVEVLRGPQGTLYGKNTIGGAINIVTAEPSNTFTAFGDVSYGNYDFIQGRATVAGAIVPDLLMVRLSATHRQRDGYMRNTVTGEKLNDINSDGLRLVLASRPSEQLRLRFSADYFTESGTSALETGPANFPAPTPAVLAAIPRQDAEDNVVQLNNPEDAHRELWGYMGRLDYSFSGAEFTSITAWRSYIATFVDDSDGLPLDAFDVGRDEKGENFSQEFRLTSTGEGPFSWILGAYYYDENTTNIRKIHLGAQMPVLLTGGMIPGFGGERAQTFSTIDAKSYAAFASGTWQIAPKVRLAGGIRWTHEKKDFFYSQVPTQTFLNLPNGLLISNFAVRIPAVRDTYKDSRWTGDVSVSYDFTDEQTAYLKYSRGFKAGGFQTDVISPPFNAADPLGFDPETVNNYEAGYKAYFFDRRLSLNLAAFYLKWNDKQEQIFTGLSFLIRNAATASSRGLEIELTARPTRNLLLDANAAYLKAKYDSFPTSPALEGERFQLTPKYTGSLGAQYTYPIADGLELFVRGDLNHRSSSYLLPNATTRLNIEALTTINGRLGVQSQDGGWGAYLWGKNINNDKVLGSGSLFPFPRAQITTRAPGFGRTYGVELRKTF